MFRFDEIDKAIADLAAGRPVIVVDDVGRKNEGDIVFAAESATTHLMAFAVRHSSGVICVPMEGHDLDRLQIPTMVHDNRDSMGTAFTVSVDATDGVTTGISAADRARTARVLANPESVAADLRRPGHVFALRSRPGGVLTRRGHTEATVDLMKLAGLAPVGVLVELVNDDGTMKRGAELRVFADAHGLCLVSIDSLVRYRRRHETLVKRGAVTRLPTPHGIFTAVGFFDSVNKTDHMAVVRGDVGGQSAVPTWVHSECVIGDVFGSSECSCRTALTTALERLGAGDLGVVIYVRRKPDTHPLDADREPSRASGNEGCEPNISRAQSADVAALMLRGLGVVSVRLMTDNSDLTGALRDGAVDVVDGAGGGQHFAQRTHSQVLDTVPL
ncbi:3,4-dihydroxy-2-butanone-4-phosphate synthase [Williamsia sp. D3]|uniref:3,4-dihydroxy-2-butanone-4-phosphate synthase n=1 Tax=Williamsia sp. D3 TaxID=1313067 RepID=UPI001268DE47|nr:3,4-dihydroxy-2-butanone-4-phosphate synthase [Williamsia sp. D3]